MKHLFLVSEANSVKNKITEMIERECDGLDYEIFVSSSREDTFNKARSEAQTGEELCVYACGGDGALNLAANAVYGYDNVTLSVIPVGTGNDFVRQFGGKKAFLTLSHIKDGVTKEIDILKANDMMCINMLNIGFDESVARKVNELRGKPFMSNSGAYTIGVAMQFLSFPKEKLRIEYDDGNVYDGEFTLTYIANGRYCGGGYNAASVAKVDDGLMDVMTVYPLSRFKFIGIVGDYRKGKIIGNKKHESLYEIHKTKRVVLSKDTPFYVCVDGETVQTDRLEVSVIENAIKFKYPRI